VGNESGSDPMGFQTDCASTGDDRERFHGSVSPPLYQSSLFTFPSYQAFTEAYDPASEGVGDRPVYSRTSNPTVQMLEHKLALLEKAEAARVVASGMAAISTAILSAARAGDHVLAVNSIYSDAFRLVQGYLPRLGTEASFADFTSPSAIEQALRRNTTVIYLESPGNPAMHLVDLPVVATLARDRGITTVVDSTMATPYNQRPLEMGIDLVVHSVSKYLAGHADVIAGAVLGSSERMRSISGHEIRDLGGSLGPFEAWLILRGVRTLGLRMEAHNRAGLQAARWLEQRPEVTRVFYPGLASHPQHGLACRQMSGYSGLLSVVLHSGAEGAIRFVNQLRLFGIGVSWGGFESLALPIQPAGYLTPEMAAGLGVVPGFVRLSIGLENIEDLLADLEQALEGSEHA